MVSLFRPCHKCCIALLSLLGIISSSHIVLASGVFNLSHYPSAIKWDAKLSELLCSTCFILICFLFFSSFPFPLF
ncbi:hypothetical protein M406DRAFT_102279 [Cryphonectria parasitica EP155]|uniref:Uncharacterized protein n=1 Tax=Cryphonectria parasitica (strain ATCC 38755 / EP155) TaxID=660469 RepID=A0A9P4Y1D1_CRYP1|nr:uncharacterized protein M406DRAFT_102279 [Cryphonectria parasitica EP155]KAF3765172.1 hypothetical protein M406DRAFT_102279 [Cryphonectria parasitica EP155]